MFGKGSLEFWFGLSFAIAGIITIVLLVHNSTDGEDVIGEALIIAMAPILLVLVIGLLITSSMRHKRDSLSHETGNEDMRGRG
jgi:phosphate starvation-inducible membrane PsiE